MISESIYYAVIFTSVRTPDDNGYNEVAEQMMKLAAGQPGFIGVDSASGETGITVSYWKSLNDISQWKKQTEHKLVQQKGKNLWYSEYKVRICKVEREYSFRK